MQVTKKRRFRRVSSGWRAELLYLAMGSIEVLWLTPWYMLLMPGVSSLPGAEIVAFVAANVFGSLLLIRWFARHHTSDNAVQIVFLAGLAAALLLTLRFVLPLDTLGAQLPLFATGKLFVPPVVLIVALIIFLWYRGLSIATITVTPARASFGLRVGIILQIFAALMPNARIQRTVLLLLPFFFFWGLLASSMARSASLRVNREMQRSSFGAGWIGFTALIGGVLSVIGFVAALLIAGFKFDSILAVIGQLFISAILVIVTILEPFMRVFATIIDTILNTLFNRQGGFNVVNMIDNLKRALGEPGPQNPLAQQLIAYSPALCVMGGFVMAVIVMLIMLRSRSRVALREGEERESLDNAAILNSLRATLQRGLDGLADVLGSLSQFGAGGAATAFTIRRLYARMSLLAEQQGYPRAAAQTPYEYQSAVLKAFPDFEREVALLTRAYVDVHYGELPDDLTTLEAARMAVERMAALPVK